MTPSIKQEPRRQQEEVGKIQDETRTCTRRMYKDAQGRKLGMK